MELLVIDDDKVFRDAACVLIEEEGHQPKPAASSHAALALLQEDSIDAVLLDVHLGDELGLDVLPKILATRPDLPVALITARASIKHAVEAMRRGAVDYLEKPFHRAQFHQVLSRLQRLNQMGRKIARLEQEVTETKSLSPDLLLDFASPCMRTVMDVLNRAAPSAASVLLLGESGTGKSALARVIHQRSRLRDRPFVTISCPCLSRELLESELFGHVKGAFTGAVKDRWGKVQAASGGTLFLDEIGDLPLEIQPKLLRLLQEREYERVGETVTRQAEVRIIAATNRNLKKRIAEGAFREDLFFRLNVIAVEVPALRNRAEDLDHFAGHYLKYFAAQCANSVSAFSPAALARVRGSRWPGNLRELRNAIERAVILSKTGALEAEDLPMDLVARNPGDFGPQPGDLITLQKLEDDHIRRVLERTSSVAEAAGVLGIDDATIYRRRERMRLVQ